MRAACGCLTEDGMVMHGFDGPCQQMLDRPTEAPEPTIEDYCREGGHAYYGDEYGQGRCYCGAETYPPAARADRGEPTP